MTRGTPDPLLRGTLELLLLQALNAEPRHGYAIARHIEQATGDALRVEEGSLYPALHRLEDRGLVGARWSTTDGGRRVRVYSLTKAGRARLADQKRGWTAFARAVDRMVKAD
ncbi:MAG: PadR family transcriptional regulator [Vicinamibacterales bacterium]